MKRRTAGRSKLPRGAGLAVMGAMPKFLLELEKQRPGIVSGCAATAVEQQKAKRRRRGDEDEDDADAWSDEDRELERQAIEAALKEQEKPDQIEHPVTAAAAVVPPPPPPTAPRGNGSDDDGRSGKPVFRQPTKRPKQEVAGGSQPKKQLLSFEDE